MELLEAGQAGRLGGGGPGPQHGDGQQDARPARPPALAQLGTQCGEYCGQEAGQPGLQLHRPRPGPAGQHLPHHQADGGLGEVPEQRAATVRYQSQTVQGPGLQIIVQYNDVDCYYRTWTSGLAASCASAIRMLTLVLRCCEEPRPPTYLQQIHFTFKTFINNLFGCPSGPNGRGQTLLLSGVRFN